MGFFSPPAGPRFALRRLRAPACLVPAELDGGEELVAVDVLIEDGRIAAVQPGGTLPPELGPDLDASIVLPGLIDCHTHLDKGHIWPRAANPTGEIADTLDACVQAGIDVVSLPTVNLYLQDRASKVTPRWRGVTVLHEMKAIRSMPTAGTTADLLVLRARTYSEMLARHQADRVVLRNGRAIDTTLPDYRQLDDLMV